MALDSLQAPPIYLAPVAKRPEVLVDQYRIMIMDPTDMSIVGQDGLQGAAGRMGRLVQTTRTSSNRGY